MSGQRHGPELSLLQISERAEKTLCRHVQRSVFQSFPQSTASVLKGLDVFTDSEGLMRVGGRLKNMKKACPMKHPVVLPKSSRLSYLIAKRAHESTGHSGRTSTMNRVREDGYYIIGLRQVCQSVIRDCAKCRRVRGVPLGQKMADLPEVRVEESSPFEHCGLDCFGPFVVQDGRKQVKRYGLMCTCLASRAVHIETLDDLSTDAFLSALRNIIAIRGTVRSIYCDRGTNFVGGDRELKKALSEMPEGELQRALLQYRCDFHFNPAYASHMSGAWERQIRSARSILCGLIAKGRERLSTSTLRTLFYEVSAIINSRPLSADAIDSPDVLAPLTPNHLVTLKHAPVLPPPGDFSRGTEFTKGQWKRAQRYVEEFWRRWKTEYLAILQKRQKWHTQRRNLKPNDIVLLHDTQFARCEWKLARVLSVKLSGDGLVRSATVLPASNLDNSGRPITNSQAVTRPIHKLTLITSSE